jgi:cell division protein FtsN
MPKDYKDRVPGSWRGPRRRQHSVWVWLLPVLLLAVAGAVAFVKYHQSERPPPPSASADSPQPGTSDAQGAVGKTGTQLGTKKPKKEGSQAKKPGKPESPPDIDQPEPRFTFYKILPEKEVIVSEREIMSLKRDEKAGKPVARGGFVIQVGAYSKLDDAEKTKARLGELKIKPKMEKVLIENAVWYRVKLGPYDTLADAEKARAQLRSHRIDSVLQQSKATR